MNLEDAKLLRACLAWATKEEETRDLDENEEKWKTAFSEMLERWKPLTDKQRQWVKNIHERLNLGVHYENLWSAGKVPRGESMATPVPEVLLRPLPKKPPQRKRED